MSKSKYFDLGNNGKLVQATKLYINNNTFGIEQEKTENNFEVDTLMAETISLLNKKGYKTLSSNAGHVYHYFIRKRAYSKEDLKTDSNGIKFMYVGYHNGTPVKYELVSQDSNDFIEYKSSHQDLVLSKDYGVFRVTIPVITIQITFNKSYDFQDLPRDWKTDDCTIMHKIFYYFDTLNIQQLEQEIIKSNEEILNWVKQLPTM